VSVLGDSDPEADVFARESDFGWCRPTRSGTLNGTIPTIHFSVMEGIRRAFIQSRSGYFIFGSPGCGAGVGNHHDAQGGSFRA
jgi:hypothetical protein